MERFEIATDRDRLGEEGPVVEFEDGDLREGIHLPKLGCPVCARHQVDVLEEHVEPLLLEKDRDSAGIPEIAAAMDLHPETSLAGMARSSSADEDAPAAIVATRPPTQTVPSASCEQWIRPSAPT